MSKELAFTEKTVTINPGMDKKVAPSIIARSMSQYLHHLSIPLVLRAVLCRDVISSHRCLVRGISRG